jgi:hypothetical protein
MRAIPISGMVVLIFGLLSGCATQINSPSQAVVFLSDPPGADVWVDNRFYVVTPGTVRLSRLSAHRARIEKVGYQPAVIELDRGMSFWTFLDLTCLFWVVKCINEDREEGGFYTLDDTVDVTLMVAPGSVSKSHREVFPNASSDPVANSAANPPFPRLPEAPPEAIPEPMPTPSP